MLRTRAMRRKLYHTLCWLALRMMAHLPTKSMIQIMTHASCTKRVAYFVSDDDYYLHMATTAVVTSATSPSISTSAN